METREYTTIDRVAKGWPSGEWDGEPDKVQWQDSATGMPCIAKRHPSSGHWCGYVGVAPGHPLYEQDYEKPDVDVHGGLTYSDACQPNTDESTGICHVPAEGEPDHVWWFGFDCAHSGDFGPSQLKDSQERGYPFTLQPDDTYATLPYVKNQCASLARQLVECVAKTQR